MNAILEKIEFYKWIGDRGLLVAVLGIMFWIGNNHLDSYMASQNRLAKAIEEANALDSKKVDAVEDLVFHLGELITKQNQTD